MCDFALFFLKESPECISFKVHQSLDLPLAEGSDYHGGPWVSTGQEIVPRRELRAFPAPEPEASFGESLPSEDDRIWSNEDIPDASDGEESACNAGDLGSIPALGRSPGEANGYLHQYFCLQDSTTEEPGGLQSMGLQRDTTERLTTFTFTEERNCDPKLPRGRKLCC